MSTEPWSEVQRETTRNNEGPGMPNARSLLIMLESSFNASHLRGVVGDVTMKVRAYAEVKGECRSSNAIA